MTVSRIAFALDDLEDEVRDCCAKGAEVQIVVMLDTATYDSVIGALANHAGLPVPPSDSMKHKGLVLVRMLAPPQD